jgi:hypothetical protein
MAYMLVGAQDQSSFNQTTIAARHRGLSCFDKKSGVTATGMNSSQIDHITSTGIIIGPQDLEPRHNSLGVFVLTKVSIVRYQICRFGYADLALPPRRTGFLCLTIFKYVNMLLPFPPTS